METQLDIATRIADARNALDGVTQTELAKRLGVTLRTVQRWERPGSSAALPHLAELSKALETTPGALLGFESSPAARPVEERLERIEAQLAAIGSALRVLVQAMAPERVLAEADELLAQELGGLGNPAASS